MKPIQLGFMDNGTGQHQSNTVWYIGGGMPLYINFRKWKELWRHTTDKDFRGKEWNQSSWET